MGITATTAPAERFSGCLGLVALRALANQLHATSTCLDDIEDFTAHAAHSRHDHLTRTSAKFADVDRCIVLVTQECGGIGTMIAVHNDCVKRNAAQSIGHVDKIKSFIQDLAAIVADVFGLHRQFLGCAVNLNVDDSPFGIHNIST